MEDKKKDILKRPPANVEIGKYQVIVHYKDDGKTVDYEEWTDPKTGKVEVKKTK